MPKIFKSLQGKAYYIKSKLTKKGNTTYYLTRTEDDTCLDRVPSGYEVFEKYDMGTMYLRRKKKDVFTAEEVEAVRQGLKANTSIHKFQVDINGNEMSVYNSINQFSSSSRDSLSHRLRDALRSDAFTRYENNMKIVKNESYEILRYCYLGRIDDWITIGSETDIHEVGEKYLYHLGKESLFELLL